ncbi:unnamed protein product [Adineta steineri]|uniref:Adenylate kinase n=1 Tax=Adineta steineri TaxID=433720 RepID=A0A818XH94_9BILA|nr:unnamed protein product [Adineta steineri]CAF4127412.1 unnamed protein product [Adineta steineri]CAF4300353.1 unnamed protein product [Adineta steineri]
MTTTKSNVMFVLDAPDAGKGTQCDRITKDYAVNLQCALLFDCDEKTSINRCMERGKDSGRIADNEETLKKRIATYQGSTKAAIQYY